MQESSTHVEGACHPEAVKLLLQERSILILHEDAVNSASRQWHASCCTVILQQLCKAKAKLEDFAETLFNWNDLGYECVVP